MPALTPALREDYETLYARMVVRAEKAREIAGLIAKIRQNIARYRAVAEATGIPWFVIAIIHCLEASLRFDRHLHNGDPLDAPTRRVPAGRPAGTGPFTWEASAMDALRLKKLDTNRDWSLAGIAFLLESYNGFGYRSHYPHVKSPYLWGFSTIYTAGKYGTDGVFSPEAVSQQAGGMVLLQALAASDATILASLHLPPQQPENTMAAPFPLLPPAAGSDVTAPAMGDDPPPFPGRYLRLNGTGEPIKPLKARLKSFGCDPGSATPRFDLPTELAVKLFQARSSLPSGEPLEIDGIVGPQTWAALFGLSAAASTPITGTPSTLSPKILAVAASQIGIREEPLGSNRGPQVNAYLARAGSPPGNPWCMAFVYWCISEAQGGVTPLPRTAGVHDCWQKAQTVKTGLTLVTARQAQANPALVVPGMVFLLDTGGGRGHAGLVSENINGALETIEGNTNDDGAREGNGVFRRTRRRVSQISLGFIGIG